MRSIEGAATVYPCFPAHGMTICKSPTSNCAATIQTNAPINPNDRWPTTIAYGELFPEPGVFVGRGSGGAVGRFALGADVVEVISHGGTRCCLAKRQAQKKGSAFAEPFLEYYAGT